MTNQNDKHLNAWLDSYVVDFSDARMACLEAAIMDEIDSLEIDIFTPPTPREWIGTTSIVAMMTLVLVMISNVSNPAPTADFASLVLGGPFMGWGG